MSGSRPSFSELDDNARNGIRACVEAAEKCLQGSARELKAVTPSALDALWVDLRADLRSRNAQDAEIKSVINMIGLAFGELLVQQLGMQWVAATDEHGKDIAVRRRGWVVHPRDVVRKRYSNDEGGFLKALFDYLSEHLNDPDA